MVELAFGVPDFCFSVWDTDITLKEKGKVMQLSALACQGTLPLLWRWWQVGGLLAQR